MEDHSWPIERPISERVMFSVGKTILLCYHAVCLESKLFAKDKWEFLKLKEKRRSVNRVSSSAELQLNQPTTSAGEVSVNTIIDDKNVDRAMELKNALIGSCEGGNNDSQAFNCNENSDETFQSPAKGKRSACSVKIEPTDSSRR